MEKRVDRCAPLVPYTASDFCAVEDGFVTNFVGQTRLGEMSGRSMSKQCDYVFKLYFADRLVVR